MIFIQKKGDLTPKKVEKHRIQSNQIIYNRIYNIIFMQQQLKVLWRLETITI